MLKVLIYNLIALEANLSNVDVFFDGYYEGFWV